MRTATLATVGGVGLSIATGTTQVDNCVITNWSLYKGTARFEILWGHAAASSATGGMKADLYDYTNNNILYTFSSNSTATIGAGDLSTALATSVVFTKPAAVAAVGLQLQNADATARTMYIHSALITIA